MRRAGLRRDAMRSHVIEALEAQDIKETDNEEDEHCRGKADHEFWRSTADEKANQNLLDADRPSHARPLHQNRRFTPNPSTSYWRLKRPISNRRPDLEKVIAESRNVSIWLQTGQYSHLPATIPL